MQDKPVPVTLDSLEEASKPMLEVVQPVPQRGKLPRNLQDRSKYKPHNGTRECARRLRQAKNEVG